MFINAAWSLVWSLTGSSASSLQDAVSGGAKGQSSRVALFAQLFTLAAILGAFTLFARFAKAQLSPEACEAAEMTHGGSAESAEGDEVPHAHAGATPLGCAATGAARRGGRAATGASVRARTSAMRRRAGLATGSESGGSTSISSREGAPGRRRAKSPDAKSPRSVPGPEPVAVVGTRRMATHRRAYSPRGGL